MSNPAIDVSPPLGAFAALARPVGGPVSVGWREATLTRAKELASLCQYHMIEAPQEGRSTVLARAVSSHIEAAREAATADTERGRVLHRLLHEGARMERALSNLDAAEADILNLAECKFVYGQLPSVLQHAQSHLIPSDYRRQEIERVAQRVGIKDSGHQLVSSALKVEDKLRIVEEERGKIVAAKRAACSAALREQIRVRSFRNVLMVTTFLMTVLAAAIAILGFANPPLIPLCFAPEESGQAMVVCPTQQSQPFQAKPAAPAGPDIDDITEKTVKPYDLLAVELVGLTAAAIAAAAAIRGIKGSSERQRVPIALALLKLPTGAVTAFVGLLLMRGQFVPGLSALDTSAQILAWAATFGYAQQLFTRLVDKQGQAVLNDVRVPNKPEPAPAVA